MTTTTACHGAASSATAGAASDRARTGMEPAVEALWSWFAAHAAELAGDEVADASIETLGRLVDGLGPFDWEIGPDDNGGAFFALSPRGDLARLADTEHFVAVAPSIPGWRFLPAKPPRQWELTLAIQTCE